MEKEVTQEVSGKKARKRTVREMEYCYEEELEGETVYEPLCCPLCTVRYTHHVAPALHSMFAVEASVLV